MYNMNPYLYRTFRTMQKTMGEEIGQQMPFKRGDLEGYVAAKDFASKPYADCTRANALASINTGTILRSDMTPKEYINILIKQGQVPNKHFTYKQTDTGYEITELNSNKEITKQVVFNKPEYDSDNPIICRYFTPDTNRQYREVRYQSDGETKTINNFEDVFVDEKLALEEMQRIEDLQKAGPQIVPISSGGNPFMQEMPIPKRRIPAHKIPLPPPMIFNKIQTTRPISRIGA